MWCMRRTSWRVDQFLLLGENLVPVAAVNDDSLALARNAFSSCRPMPLVASVTRMIVFSMSVVLFRPWGCINWCRASSGTVPIGGLAASG